MPSAAAAAGAGNGNGQASSQPAPDNGVAGGAVSPAAAAAPADGSPEKQSAPESSHPQPSQPSMDVTADADGGKARQVSWLALPRLADAAGRGYAALIWSALLLTGSGRVCSLHGTLGHTFIRQWTQDFDGWTGSLAAHESSCIKQTLVQSSAVMVRHSESSNTLSRSNYAEFMPLTLTPNGLQQLTNVEMLT